MANISRSASKGFRWFHNPLTLSILWLGLGGVILMAYNAMLDYLDPRALPIPQEVSVPIVTDSGPAGFSRTLASLEEMVTGRSAMELAASQEGGAPMPVVTRSKDTRIADAWSLLDDLYLVGTARNFVTRQSAETLNLYFDRLERLGAAAVPVILEFLASGKDVKFTTVNGDDLVDAASLRAGLIETLGRIGGPEAIDALEKILAETAEPVEIAALAKALEGQAPGMYRQELLRAARESMQIAAEAIAQTRNKPRTKRDALDVSPLFDVVRALGDTHLLRDMMQEAEQTMPPWKLYSMIALSQMGNEEAVSILQEVLVDVEGQLSKQNLFALQMLGQTSRENPQAANALIEVVSAYGQDIPLNDWKKLIWTLRGHSYDFGGTLDSPGTGTNATSHDNRSVLNVTMPSLNLHLQRNSANPSTWPADQVDRQITLIDQLLATGPPPKPTEDLELARDWILRRAGHGNY